MHLDSGIEAMLCGFETELMQAEIRSSGRVEALLADHFIEFGSAGHIFTKTDILDGLEAEANFSMTASQFKAVKLTEDTVQLLYRTERHVSPPVYCLRSSIWQCRHRRWTMVFHQSTVSNAEAQITPL